MNLPLKKLKIIKIITFSNTWTVQIAKFPGISHFFNQHDSSLGHHVNAASHKSLEIQAYSQSQNEGPILSKNFYELTSFQLLLYIMKVKSQEDQ